MTTTFSTLLPEDTDGPNQLAAKQTSAANAVNGWKDDGSESGIVATRPAFANLVPRAIRLGTTNQDWMRYEASGSGTTVVNAFRVLKSSDYSGHLCTVTCAAVADSFVRVKFRVYGRRFGVSWYYTSGQPTEPFTVIIDGRSYEVAFQVLDPYKQTVITSPDPFLQWVCPDLLGDGPHDIELVFLGLNGGSSRAWILRNILLDASAGYVAQRPLDILGPRAIAANSWGTYAPSSPWDASNCRIRRVFCYNYSASAADIFLADAGADASVFWSAKAVAAGATAVCDLGPDGAGIAPLYMKASAATSFYVSVQANIL